MLDIITLNKFSHIHDGINIIFCKTDFLLSEFEYIQRLGNEVILISGNSDYPIDDYISSKKPKNIKKWYAQNVLTYDDKIIPIPMGIENKNDSFREGHGVGYHERVALKESLLNSEFDIEPTYQIYSNFEISTNYRHRGYIKEICIQTDHIDWDEPTLNLPDFFNKIKKYKMTVCPAGNGVDTHRIWEVLYSGRIPITFKIGNFKIYELYEQLPIIILNNVDDLKNKNLLFEKYEQAKKNYSNIQILNYSYWESKIKSEIF